MAGWKLDPDGTTLDLTDGSTFKLLEQSFPMPDVETQYATSVDATRDTLTGLRYKNRTITLKLLASASTTALLETALAGVSQKVGKINRDAIVGGTGVGGTLQYTSSGGSVVTFDVVRASVVADTGFLYANRKATTVTVELECLPAWRGAETTPGDHTETTLPVLTFTESSVTGDLPGLGRLVIDEDQSKDQLTVVYGVRSKNYSSDSTAALFWQAEALTAVGAGATAAAGPSGASGSGSNTMYANALTTTYQDLLKSTVSTTYWTHVGAYRVLVRAQAKGTNTGDVSLRASWAQADVTNYTQGTAAGLSAAGSWCMVDLGVVQVPPVVTGTQRWELRVQGSSTVNGDAAYVDFIWLVPVDECSGVASVAAASGNSTLTVSDTFNQSPASPYRLNGVTPSPLTDGAWAEPALASVTGVDSTDTFTKTAHGWQNGQSVVLSSLTGGSALSTSTTYYIVNRAANTFQLSTSVGGGAVNLGSDVSSVVVTRSQFAVDTTNHLAQRTGVSDSTSGSGWNFFTNAAFATASTSSGGQYAQVDFGVSADTSSLYCGLLLRYTDTSNWAATTLDAAGWCRLFKCVSGTVTQLVSSNVFIPALFIASGQMATIKARISSAGAFEVTTYLYGGATGYLSATDSVLAAGGALGTGKMGLFDYYSAATACTRKYDNFQAGTIVSDAACYAGQSIQVRHDGVVRSFASGIWARPSRFDGDYLLVPASGKEARPVEVTCRMSRTTLGSAGDDGVDDISAKLYVQPRGLQLPS